MLDYTNPRTVAEFDDWPSGQHRVKCKIFVEEKKGKYRVGRMTTSRFGVWNNPKYGTYAGPTCIVDGSDKKTYILQFIPMFAGVSIIRWDFTTSEEGTVYADYNRQRYDYLLDIIKSTPKE